MRTAICCARAAERRFRRGTPWRALRAAASFLALAGAACAPADPGTPGSLTVRADGTTCELRVELPPEAVSPALSFGRHLVDQPWDGAGNERLVVSLDADGFLPLAPIEGQAGHASARLPLRAVLESLGEEGRYAQARWRRADGAWVLGTAWHLSAPTSTSASGSTEPVLRPARTVAARRALWPWIGAGACLALAPALAFALRRAPRARLPLAVLLLAGAWLASWPRAREELAALRWEPDPLFLDFVRRAAEIATALPADVGIAIAGPSELRCRAAAALPTDRLAHFARENGSARGGAGALRRWARLGPDLELAPGEVVAAVHAEWKLVLPRELDLRQ